MKYVLLTTLALIFTACNSGDSYVKEAPAIPDAPANGKALIVTTTDEAKTGIQYTEVGDGSILVTCGDGDNYTCAVYEASKVETGDSNGSN